MGRTHAEIMARPPAGLPDRAPVLLTGLGDIAPAAPVRRVPAGRRGHRHAAA